MWELASRFVIVGAFAYLAGFLFEQALRYAGRPTRFAWTFSLLATLLLPVMPRLLPDSTPVLAPVADFVVPALTIEAGPARGGAVFGSLQLMWLLLSAVVGAWYVAAYIRMRRAGRAWQQARVADHDVELSDRFGPAVFGFVAPRIVLPRWVRETSSDEQKLIVVHERQHIDAHDQLQVLLTLLATTVLPWNPLVWLQSRRLRFALEADCDQRVLAAIPDRQRYANLLVHVGSRQMNLLLTPALAEHRNGLERRIAMLLQHMLKNRWKAGGLLLVGAFFTILACEARLPSDVENLKPIDNAELIEQNYPKSLRDAGVGGTTVLRAYVTDGEAEVIKIHRSSGNKELDHAAAQVAKHRAWNETGANGKSEYWVTTSVSFNSQQGVTPERQAGPARAESRTIRELPRKISDEPSYTPYTGRPELQNRDEVARSLGRAYPPELRAAGTGGTAMVWLQIDEAGVVRQTRVKTTSGHAALDAAAVEVAARMKFKPAQDKGRPVPVWIAMPVVFGDRN